MTASHEIDGLPLHSVRPLHPLLPSSIVADLVRLGLGTAEAETMVRRSSSRIVRLDFLPPRLADDIARAFRAHGGLAHAGKSAYATPSDGNDDPVNGSVDLLLLGTAGQMESLATEFARHEVAGNPHAYGRAIARASVAATWSAGRLRLGQYVLNLDKRAAVMGILNVTPDSFHDGGRYFDPERAVDRGLQMVEEGADLIDVGGDSANGDAPEIDATEEIRRIGAVVQALAKRVPVPIAVDTHRSATAQATLDVGATLINDITGLADPEMAPTIARSEAGVCVMHIKGRPKSYPPDWHYRSLLGDIIRFLEARTTRAVLAGIARDRICIDPGIEFGKLVGQDLDILRRIPELHVLGYPVLIAASRKTLIGNVLGKVPSSDRLEGTAAVNALAISRGARIIRVHDVREMRRVATMTEALALGSVDETSVSRMRADGHVVDWGEILQPSAPD